MHNLIAELESLLTLKETEHLEFKEAKSSFNIEKTVMYCAAIANERGGKLVLGVTDKLPRLVVGTSAFQNLDKIKKKVFDELNIRVNIREVQHPDVRVLIFDIPSRTIGQPIRYKGRYLMRIGDSISDMPPNTLKEILDEEHQDFSSEICKGASLTDLDDEAIHQLRNIWSIKSGNKDIRNSTDSQLLNDIELIVNNRVTYAALILLGKRKAIRDYIPRSELVFEYRANEAKIEYDAREEFNVGFFKYFDDLWKIIDNRNTRQYIQDGFFKWDIKSLNEEVVREAILNAISHRDYRHPGSVFIRQYPEKISVSSPGGFPEGVNPENILTKQVPRNRRIADVLAKCGLVERSNQGTRLMFRQCIMESKALPDYSQSDRTEVVVDLSGKIEDPGFISFLEKIGKETQTNFSSEDYLILDSIRKKGRYPKTLERDIVNKRIQHLLKHNVVERPEKGKHHLILSRKYYSHLGEKGTYTRKKGLDKETNKALLLEHIKTYNKEGSTMSEFMQVLPDLSRRQISSLLNNLKNEGKIKIVGATKAAHWFTM
ncbi:putative DNA binding domain-containing protein [bacterium]|nr:putative DNA binding domain-containing protein [bacterium]